MKSENFNIKSIELACIFKNILNFFKINTLIFNQVLKYKFIHFLSCLKKHFFIMYWSLEFSLCHST